MATSYPSTYPRYKIALRVLIERILARPSGLPQPITYIGLATEIDGLLGIQRKANARWVGHSLGAMGRRLRDSGEYQDMPNINCLVVRKEQQEDMRLPGKGLDEFCSGYSSWPPSKKSAYAQEQYAQMMEYGDDRWREILGRIDDLLR